MSDDVEQAEPPPWPGHLYDLKMLQAGEFRATGLDAAHRVARRVNEAVRAALEADPEVRSVERAPLLGEAASPKIDVRGYGQGRVSGVLDYAHRRSYAEMVGPIPPGLTIDHLCEVRSCVRPDHLEPVTRAENGRRMQVSRRPRWIDLDVDDLVERYRAGESIAGLARGLGVSRNTVRRRLDRDSAPPH